MKPLLFVSYCLILVAAQPPALPKPGCEPKSPGFSRWSGVPSSILKRGVRDPWHYYVDFEIGYPPQNVSLVLDTGSSDIWISGPEVCHNCTFETYNVSASVSSKLIDKDRLFFENYGPTVTGFYMMDEFSVADTTVLNVSFGVVKSTDYGPNNPGGILGIGLIGFQTIAVGCPSCGQNAPPLPGLLDQLKAQEVINISTYGIYLGGQSYWDATPGRITFGGYNPARFAGDLIPLPMAPAPDQYPRLQVWLSSVSVTANGNTEFLQPGTMSGAGTSVLLDTGSPGSSIPSSMYYQLTEVLEVDPVNSQVDCEYMESDGGLTFSFYGFDGKYADIWVPFKQVIRHLTAGDPGVCILTIGLEVDCSRGNSRFNCSILGEDFLRAAYIYVNYDNLTVSMAQAAYDSPDLYHGAIEQVGSRVQAPLNL